jgi:hypothetical protein
LLFRGHVTSGGSQKTLVKKISGPWCPEQRIGWRHTDCKVERDSERERERQRERDYEIRKVHSPRKRGREWALSEVV